MPLNSPRHIWNPGTIQVVLILKIAGPLGFNAIVENMRGHGPNVWRIIQRCKGLWLIDQEAKEKPYFLTEKGHRWAEGYVKTLSIGNAVAHRYNLPLLKQVLPAGIEKSGFSV